MISPPQLHMQVEVLFKAGILAIKTVGEPRGPWRHKPRDTWHGVKTPMAAVVAAATVGFDGLIHIPKGMMFTMGHIIHNVCRAGLFSVSTRLTAAQPGWKALRKKTALQCGP